MYYCKNCRKEFFYARVYNQWQGGENGGYERFLLCPFCNSTDFFEKRGEYCSYCGMPLKLPGRKYCSVSCQKNGERLYEKEQKRKEKRKSDGLITSITEVADYNKRTGNRLSYGQYFALKGVGAI